MADAMKRRNLKNARAQARGYSQAVVTEGGRVVWLAGQVAGEDSSGRSLAADLRLGDRFTQLRCEIFGDDFPASALITVAGLARPEMLVEVQGIAVIA